MEFTAILNQFSSLSLAEIKELELMRRVNSKYVFALSQLPQLLSKLQKEYKVLEVAGERMVAYANQYFDSSDLQCYHNHHNKRANRFKVRIRQYKGTDVSFLELKQKNNKGETIKNRVSIPGFSKLTKEHFNFLEQFICLPKRGIDLNQESSFNRITLVSFKSKERITIDTSLRIKVDGREKLWDYIVIVEVKREKGNGYSPIESVLKEMKIYPRSFSKYCLGMSYLKEGVKYNTFKPNLLYLEKLKKLN